MATTIDINDFSPTGVAVISDSLDVPVIMEDLTEGLNGFVIYAKKHFERTLIVQFRSKTAYTAFLNGLTETDGGQVNFDSKTYYLKPMSLTENWGEAGGQWSGAAWTYNITLVRE